MLDCHKALGTGIQPLEEYVMESRLKVHHGLV